MGEGDGGMKQGLLGSGTLSVKLPLLGIENRSLVGIFLVGLFYSGKLSTAGTGCFFLEHLIKFYGDPIEYIVFYCF